MREGEKNDYCSERENNNRDLDREKVRVILKHFRNCIIRENKFLSDRNIYFTVNF